MREDIKAIQAKLLDITIYFDSFCKEYNIEYYLMGGSALGAMRHNGFIPWDDDLDVFMTYDNYELFLTKARHCLDTSNYYLQEENTEEWPMFFSKLRQNGTTFIEENTIDRDMHHGLYIDIMCLNYVSSIRPVRYLQYSAALLLTAKSIGDRGYKTNKSRLKSIAMLLCSFLIRGPVMKFLLRIVRMCNSRRTSMVGHFFGKAPFSKTSFPLIWLGQARYTKFETYRLPVPEKVEEYLTLRYGDFMKMPTEETKSQYPSHAFIVDLETHYTQYLKPR